MKQVCCLVVLFYIAGFVQPEAYAQSAAPQSGVLEDKWRDFVHLSTLKMQPLPGAFRVTGTITYDEDRTQHMAAPLSGRVTQVFVDLGAQVTPGTPLVELSAPEAAAVQAEVQRAQQDFDVATHSFNRAKTLRADGAVSERDAAQAQADYKKAQVDLQRAQAQHKALGLTGQGAGVRMVLRARQKGTVVERHVRVGQEVRQDSGEVLLTVSDLDAVWVLADLYEQDLARIHRGDAMAVSVAAYPQESFAGEVLYISDVLDAQTRTVKVRCRVPNLEHRLKPAMFATLEMFQPDSQGLVVPTVAVIREGAQLFVLTLAQDNKTIVPRAVRLGPAHGGLQQVIAGLQAGETIITDGALFVHHALRQG